MFIVALNQSMCTHLVPLFSHRLGLSGEPDPNIDNGWQANGVICEVDNIVNEYIHS